MPIATVIEINNAAYGEARRLWAIGNSEILHNKLLGFFCSVQCPGHAIIKTYDLARALRDAAIPIIGGFHSPMEQECLRLLLRGHQPVVVCPARNIERMRIPADWRQPLADNRLLILSSFEAKHRRPTAALAERRNRLVAALADAVFMAYAAPGGKTERLCTELIAHGKPVYTHDLEENRHLMRNGAYGTELNALIACINPS